MTIQPWLRNWPKSLKKDLKNSRQRSAEPAWTASTLSCRPLPDSLAKLLQSGGEFRRRLGPPGGQQCDPETHFITCSIGPEDILAKVFGSSSFFAVYWLSLASAASFLSNYVPQIAIFALIRTHECLPIIDGNIL